MSLLSTVYSQSWPAPDPVRGPRKGFFGKRPREAATSRSERPRSAAPFLQIQGQTINPSQQRTAYFRSKSAIGLRSSHPGAGDAATPPGSINGQLGLDKTTLHWKSWSSYKSDCEQADTDADLYKLTTCDVIYGWRSATPDRCSSVYPSNHLSEKPQPDTFRRLSQQIKDVDQQLSGRYHNSGFKSYYVVDDKTVVPALRRSQLAASLPSQPPSICSPTPHELVSFRPSEDLQCTTVRSVQRKKRPQSSFVRSFRPKIKRPPRPKSSATILGRHDDSSSCSSSSTKGDDIRKNDFDHITPKVIDNLAEGDDKDFRESQPGPFDIVNEAEKPKAPESEDENSCDDEECDEDEHYTDEDGELVKRKSHKQIEDHDGDDVFVDESGYRIRELPDFDLQPEDLDVDDSPRGQFNYNSSNMSGRMQDVLPEPLSHPFCHMDLLGLSEFRNWKKELKKVPQGLEEELMDRMIEIAKLQANTAHWERCQGKGSSRPPSSLQVKKGWNADAAIPTERMHNALSKPKQSKNCQEDCTQQACAGDCKNKNGKKCPYCKQSFCNGACVEYEYHLFVRTPRDDDDVMPARPKSCKNCCHSSSSKNHVKSTLNANTVVLGRPKSAFATFSSAKHQVGKPKALSMSQTAGADQVSSDLARLGLRAPNEKQENGVKLKERPHTAKARVRLKGRDAILPGKSFQSQRRNSLTEDLISTSACSMNTRAMRARSARMRAQKRCKSAKK